MKNWLNGLRWGTGVITLGGALMLGGFGLVGAANGSGGWGERGESEYGGREYGEREYGEREYGERESGEEGERFGFRGRNAGRTPDPLYVEECSACHMAYPAHLLPARSWQAIMNGLEDHFGENAALLPETTDEITAYLVANAADVNPGPRSDRFLRGIAPDAAPLRITETRYFKRKHDEIPKKKVEGNPEVRSFSQCQACHGKEAVRGIFDEDSVDIPGYGRYED
ncbi:MAG: diheme cytochrome c [Pseudomonadota bacterium]|nr:diheme cytochrome c [Pseudomonadota bacterium]